MRWKWGKNMHDQRIFPGGVYGKTKVLGLSGSSTGAGGYKLWDCVCLNCGKKFTMPGYSVITRNNAGCTECRAKRKGDEYRRKALENAKKDIGKKYGSLEVIGIKPECEKKNVIAICKCHKCGSISNISLSRLHSGQAKQCAKCGRKNLETGKKLIQDSAKEGTSPIFLLGDRAKNKNNTSGHTGISWMPKYQKWRAYINFKRKQYNLGVYSDINDAIAARKEAEKQIWGDFLEYYKNTYPENWEKIQKIKGSS